MQYQAILRGCVALLATASAMPTAAFQPQLLQHRPMTKQLPGTMNPANNVQRIVHLSRLPDAMVSIDTMDHYCAPSTYPHSPTGLVAFDGTLYVRNDCQGEAHINFIASDRINLTPVFAHGFRIDHVVFEDLAAPTHGDGWRKQAGQIAMGGAANYPLTGTKTLITPSMAAGWNAIRGPHVLHVKPPRYETGSADSIHQTDAYRLDIYVVGPAGIDPYTGNKISRPAIN